MTVCTRRQWLAAVPALAAAGAAPAAPPDPAPFVVGLNTSTLRGHKLDIVEVIDIAAAAGFRAIEPWLDELEKYVQGGGDPKGLGQRFRDKGLEVPSAIAFFEWAVDDDARRAKALENAKRAMDLVAKVGGTRIAAPPAGAQNQADLNLFKLADRYRALLELGDQLGVTPELEFWGFSRVLRTLGEAALVAAQAGHPKACILADVYHVHKGGSPVEGLRLLAPGVVPVIHVNDYPASPPRESITDAARIFPGDGVAPVTTILRHLNHPGGKVVLSLELFNRDYWMQDPRQVAKTGAEKVRAAAEKALAK